MNLFLSLAYLFFIGSVLGWVLELFFRKFFGKFKRKTESIVKPERLFAGNFRFGHVRRVFFLHKRVFTFYTRDALIELFNPRGKRRLEFFGLYRDFVQNILFFFDKQGIRFAVNFFYKDFSDAYHFGGVYI